MSRLHLPTTTRRHRAVLSGATWAISRRLVVRPVYPPRTLISATTPSTSRSSSVIAMSRREATRNRRATTINGVMRRPRGLTAIRGMNLSARSPIATSLLVRIRTATIRLAMSISAMNPGRNSAPLLTRLIAALKLPDLRKHRSDLLTIALRMSRHRLRALCRRKPALRRDPRSVVKTIASLCRRLRRPPGPCLLGWLPRSPLSPSVLCLASSTS